MELVDEERVRVIVKEELAAAKKKGLFKAHKPKPRVQKPNKS